MLAFGRFLSSLDWNVLSQLLECQKMRDLFYDIIFMVWISGGSSVSQNKLPQLILGYIHILKYLQSNFIG